MELEIHNSEGKEVYGLYIWFPRTTLACVELPLHKTWGPYLLVWKVELDPSFNVEVKLGESYDIEVSFRFPERSTVTTPIRVVVGS
ncbi:MAG: hypothetical protein ACFFCW_47835 [Candidatus Hodarchaeota archaeon]